MSHDERRLVIGVTLVESPMIVKLTVFVVDVSLPAHPSVPTQFSVYTQQPNETGSFNFFSSSETPCAARIACMELFEDDARLFVVVSAQRSTRHFAYVVEYDIVSNPPRFI